jgi:hypothetical protein
VSLDERFFNAANLAGRFFNAASLVYLMDQCQSLKALILE